MNLPPLWSEPLALGFSIFPCQYLTKRPAVKWEAFQNTRADAATLAAWVSSQYNVATATGALSGTWVLDTDSPEAEAAFLKLGTVPDTLTAKTPRGRHRYYRYPAGVHIGNRAKLAGTKGIDVRGQGGYVMSPGSFFWPDATEAAEGKLPGSYQWEQAPTLGAIVDAPDWLLALVTRSNEPPVQYGELASPAVAVVTSEYGRRALTAECNNLRAAVPGERNDQLNRSAFAIAQLVAGGDIVVAEAADAIRAAAAEIGLEPDEIEQTLGSGWKSGVKQPRKGVSVDAATAFGAVAPVLPAGASAEPPPRHSRFRSGDEYMSAELQLEHFKDCVWVQDEDRIWIGTEFLSQRQFEKRFGGRRFVIDAQGQRPTKSAWEAFTESLLLEMVWTHGTCFRPDLPTGTVVETEQRTFLNTYVPIETLRVSGDPGPFLDFLSRILPVERDRRILLSYLAALIQNPGRKFQWWPVIQGTKGNGKSAISTIMQHAIGEVYSHLPNVAKMARNGINFNAWLDQRLFVGLEEVYAANRRDFLEEFKPYVTNSRISIEKKGVDETTGSNLCNGIALTNHRDGVPIDDDERRYAVFFTAQQRAEDLVRDGMDGNYFPDFYNWLYGREAHAARGENYGLAVCNDFLRTYAVEAEFNPAGGCVRAPRSSTYAEAVRGSLGSVEQEVMEQIEQNATGFAGGWVSSQYLNSLLTTLNLRIPRNKRPEMMRHLGYIYHPALQDGRVNALILPDNSKPRLYIRSEHPALAVTDPAEVARAYTRAQDAAVTEGNVLAFKRSGAA